MFTYEPNGRVAISDRQLAEIESHFVRASAGGGPTNGSCGGANTDCTNSTDCRTTTNSGICINQGTCITADSDGPIDP